MRGFLARGVLPFLAFAAVVAVLMACACGFIEGELALAATMKYAGIEDALKSAFIGFLFVFATGIPVAIALKKLRIRSIAAYLLAGAVCGVLAEHCYFLEMDIWDAWDFTTPRFASVLEASVQNMPAIVAGMATMLPESAIPVGVGLLTCGLYWLAAGRRRMPKAAAGTAGDSGPSAEQLFRTP
ncbi:MAG TPA: hypothetical protein VMU01_12225 [Rhizomicrobium sp.]|nr:hypothetical protein [Rhizomicrobium sp.]